MIRVLDDTQIEAMKEYLSEETYERLSHSCHLCTTVNNEGYWIACPCAVEQEESFRTEVFHAYCSEQVLVLCSAQESIRLAASEWNKQDCPAGGLVALLSTLTQRDVEVLEAMEDDIETLEDHLLAAQKQIRSAEKTMIRIKRELLYRKRYYEQLHLILDELDVDEIGLFDEQSRRHLHYLRHRVGYLLDSVLHLRDYITQVREAYQAGIDIEQNQVMKIFTVVTAVFLPLTLIVGWYGMNFSAMPELAWRGGYAYVICLSVLVCLICFLFIRRKKWF